MYDFQAGETYSFQTFAPGLLGNNFQNILVKAVLDADTAALFADIQALHRQLWPYINQANPALVNDPTQYTYLRLQGISGDAQIIAVQWIDPASITSIANQTLYITIPNTLPSEVDNIRAAIVAQGKSNLSMELK